MFLFNPVDFWIFGVFMTCCCSRSLFSTFFLRSESAAPCNLNGFGVVHARPVTSTISSSEESRAIGAGAFVLSACVLLGVLATTLLFVAVPFLLLKAYVSRSSSARLSF